MKTTPLFIVLAAGVVIAGGLLVVTEPSVSRSPEAVNTAPGLQPPLTADAVDSVAVASPSERKSSQHTHQFPVPESETDQQAPVVTLFNAPDASSLQRVPGLRSMADQLDAEQGLSDHNLMLLQELAQRMVDAQAGSASVALSEISAIMPSPALAEALQRIVAAGQKEVALHAQWQGNIMQDVQGYQQALMALRSEVLGAELYSKLYAADLQQVSDDGFSAEVVEAQGEARSTEASRSDAHARREALLAQWQAGEVSESVLREALLDDLSEQEVAHLIETGQHERDWLNRMGRFLEEYRYVEQAGLAGDDEQLMRQELIEKHFLPEDHHTVDQFLFGWTGHTTDAAPADNAL